MAGPFGRLCRPLLNAVKNNGPKLGTLRMCQHPKMHPLLFGSRMSVLQCIFGCSHILGVPSFGPLFLTALRSGRQSRSKGPAISESKGATIKCEKIKNEILDLSRPRLTFERAEQQRKAALKTLTDQGMAYVTSKDQVLARCHFKERKGGEEEREEEGDEKEEEEGEGEGEKEDEEEGDEDDPLGHKSNDWQKGKWQGKIVYSEDLDARTKSSTVKAADDKNLKYKGYDLVDSLKK